MDVILLQDVDKLGKENELVKVRNGYARNFLLPKRLAVVADDSQKKMLNERVKHEERREQKLLNAISQVQDVLKNTKYIIGAKTGMSGKIFGSVTTIQLSHAIKKQSNIAVDRKKITLPDDVSMVGEYKASIALGKDVNVEVNFEVIAE
ncbi:MAG TPA: 50S ribosomal protein L9 [Chitinophagales bacterium]|nr:50S ribosomal protein L9 [Chitinophagales bacterium]